MRLEERERSDLGGDEVAAPPLGGDNDGLLGPLGGHRAGRDEVGGGAGTGRTGPGGARAAAVLVGGARGGTGRRSRSQEVGEVCGHVVLVAKEQCDTDSRPSG